MKYIVIQYDERPDGRIKPSGTEHRELTHEQAIALSNTAIVVSMTSGINGSRTIIHKGKHCQFDSHLGWLS